MILTIGNVKGGVGKTTLALNFTIALAKKKREVLLIDGDEQQTSMEFTERRSAAQEGSAGYTSVALFGKSIQTQVKALTSKYDDIVIDCGGRDTGSLRASLLVSDVVLIPVLPRSFDLWGVLQTAELVSAARQWNEALIALCVLNSEDSTGADNDAARAELRQLDSLRVLDRGIVRRKAFANAASEGKGIVEWDDAKALKEFMWVFATVHSAQKS
jgi:chromosome partitioning protein